VAEPSQEHALRQPLPDRGSVLRRAHGIDVLKKTW
jgi:hypothetical protein